MSRTTFSNSFWVRTRSPLMSKLRNWSYFILTSSRRRLCFLANVMRKSNCVSVLALAPLGTGDGAAGADALLAPNLGGEFWRWLATCDCLGGEFSLPCSCDCLRPGNEFCVAVLLRGERLPVCVTALVVLRDDGVEPPNSWEPGTDNLFEPRFVALLGVGTTSSSELPKLESDVQCCISVCLSESSSDFLVDCLDSPVGLWLSILCRATFLTKSLSSSLSFVRDRVDFRLSVWRKR